MLELDDTPLWLQWLGRKNTDDESREERLAKDTIRDSPEEPAGRGVGRRLLDGIARDAQWLAVCEGHIGRGVIKLIEM